MPDSVNVRPSPDVVVTELDGGDGVLVDLDSKRYYELNETAMLVWKALDAGRTIDEIVAELTRAYDVSAEHARESIDRTLRELSARSLITGYAG